MQFELCDECDVTWVKIFGGHPFACRPGIID